MTTPSRTCSHPSPSTGFTLVELLVTIAIVAIMAAFAAPDLVLFVRNSTVRSATTELASAINFARSEAVKRGWPVSLCKSADINTSSPICSTTADWKDGWLIFVDEDGDGVVDTDDLPLRVGGVASDQISISSSNFTNRISYLPTGVSNNNGSFTLCLSDIARRIVINKPGRLRIESGGCA